MKKVVLTVPIALMLGIALPAFAAGTLLSSSEQAAQVMPGGTNTFTVVIGNTGSDQVLVDLELKDANGQKIGQAFYDNQSIPSSGKSYSFTTQALPMGNYSFSVGLFTPGWGSLEQWYESVQKFSVGTGGTSSGPTPHNVIVPNTGNFTVTPGFNVTHGTPVTDTLWITNTDSVAHTVLIDMEMHRNNPDQKLDQKFWDNQTFAPGETKQYQMTTDTTNLLPDQYTFKLGIFEPGWSSLIDWWSGLGAFQVQ